MFSTARSKKKIQALDRGKEAKRKRRRKQEDDHRTGSSLLLVSKQAREQSNGIQDV